MGSRTQIGIKITMTALLALFLSEATVKAQVATSSMRGQVLDPSGAPLPGATVTAELIGTGLKTNSVTDGDGRFFIGGLRPGAYTVAAELVGFKRAVQEGLFLRLRDTLQLEFALELAGVEAEVVVTAEAPVLDTSSPAVSQAVTQQEIEALPLGDRDFMDLALLTPGVKEGRDPTLLGTQVAIGAQDSASTYISSDGVDTTSHFIGGTFQTFIQETIQEFRVVASSFGTDIGRTNSGAITVITKSGANQVEGSVWEYFRHNKLQKTSEFLEPNEDFEDNFERHQFGALVSGPIIKDKAHFLVAFERRQQDSTLGTPPAAAAALGLSGDQLSFPQELRTNNLLAKIDLQVGENQHAFLRYTRETRETINSPNLTGFEVSVAMETNYFEEDQTTDIVMLNHTFSPFENSFNSLSLNYISGRRPNKRNTEAPEELRQSSRQGGFFLAGFDDAQDNSLGLREDFTVQAGRHTLKFGGDFQRRHLQLDFPVFSNGQYNFACLPALPIGPGGALVPDPLGCSADRPFNPLNPFSYPAALIKGTGNPRYDQDRNVVSLYAQDDIRISDRLNVNLGVRWDYDSDQFNSSFTSPLIDENVPIPGPLQPALNPLRAALRQSGLLDTPDRDYNNIAPRFGFSFDVAGDGKTLVRGGAGQYYGFLGGTAALFPQVLSGLQAGPFIIGEYAVNLTFLPDYTPTPGTTFTNVLRGGAPAQVVPLIYAMDPDAKTPYTLQATLGVARALGQDMAITLDGVIAEGRNEMVTIDTNAPRQAIGDTNGDGVIEYNPASRPVPFGPIRTFKTIGESHYKSIQVGFNRRYRDGWQMQANYTLSKAENWQDNPTSEQVQDSNHPDQDEGPTTQDQRHIFNLSGAVDLPGGFQLSALTKVASGSPFPTFVGADLNNDGFRPDRPGNVERNEARADTYFRLDARLSKEFTFGERFRLLLLAEGFNLTNHSNYDPDTYNGFIGSAGFGKPTTSSNGTFDPLQVQLGARLRF